MHVRCVAIPGTDLKAEIAAFCPAEFGKPPLVTGELVAHLNRRPPYPNHTHASLVACADGPTGRRGSQSQNKSAPFHRGRSDIGLHQHTAVGEGRVSKKPTRLLLRRWQPQLRSKASTASARPIRSEVTCT